MTAAAVDVTVSDDDAAPTGVTLTVDTDDATDGNQASVAEGAGATTVTVTAALTGGTTFADSKTVTVAVGAGTDTATEGTDYTTVADFTVTIAAGSSSGSGTFTLTPTDDAADEGDEKLSVSGTLGGLTVTGAEVTITDNDGTPTGVTLTVDTDGTTAGNQAGVSEGAGATTVSVTATLTGGTTFGESKTVTVAVGSDGDTAVEGTDYGTVADFTITIAASASSGSGTFTLTPTDDDADESDETLSVTGTLAGLTVTGVEVTITDDDTVGVTVSETALTVAEADDPNTSPGKEHEATYTVVLTSEPAASVTVTPATTAGTVVGLSGALTFTSTNWDDAQTVTVTAKDDDADNANDKRTARVTHTVSGAGSGYESVVAAAVDVTVTDDDTAGVTVSETALTVAEVDDPNTSPGKEHEATYTVVLDAQPAADVTVTPATTASTVVGLSGALTFTSTNWSTPRTVTVTGKNDDADNAGDKRTARVTHTVSGAGSGYESVTAAAVDVTVTDDDDAPSGVTLTVDTDGATDGNQASVSEGAGATTVTVTAALTGGTTFGESKTVTVAVGSDSDTAVEGTDYAMVADFTVTIAADASSGSGTFTLTPTDDDSDEGDEKLSVTGTLAGLTVTGAEVTITDDDTVGVTVSETALTVAEVDDTDTTDKTENVKTYTVVLDAQPAADVTVTPATTASTVVGLSGALTFTSTNWSTPRTVTVTAKDDAIDNANDRRTARIIHTVAGAGSGYESVTAAAVDVTVSDDDTESSTGAGTDLTITPLSVEVAEDGGTATLSIKLANDPAPAGTEQRLASRYDTDVYIERVTRSDGTTDNSRFTMFDRLKAISVDPEAHNISPLQFTAGASGNWATARTVTITGRADDVSGDRTVKLRFAKDTPGSSVETVEVTVTVKDDEGGGLTFTPSQVRVTEAGDGSAKLYTVALSEAPAGDTTVRVSSETGRRRPRARRR